jgi:hypothetical protein
MLGGLDLFRHSRREAWIFGDDGGYTVSLFQINAPKTKEYRVSRFVQ